VSQQTEPFIGEIRIFAGTFAPDGWALCNGGLLSIAQFTALFSILGTTYGGNGTTNFALPNLQGCSPLQQGFTPGLTERDLGEEGGAADVTLGTAEMAGHTHLASASTSSGTSGSPGGAVWAKASFGKVAVNLYSTAAPNVVMSPAATGPNGGNLPHNNMQPYLSVNFIIALAGIFPQRSEA
jgi:microcystin-dependent protein